MTDSGSISFHAVGDSRGVRSPQAQQIVTIAMEADFVNDNDAGNKNTNPTFFYNLGDRYIFMAKPAPIILNSTNHTHIIQHPYLLFLAIMMETLDVIPLNPLLQHL